MQDFMIEFKYKGESMILPCKLIPYGYSHKLDININGVVVSYEPDEEGSYRAVVAEVYRKSVDQGLLKAIAEQLEMIVR